MKPVLNLLRLQRYKISINNYTALMALSVGTSVAFGQQSTVATFSGGSPELKLGPSGRLEIDARLVGYGAGQSINVGGDPNMAGYVQGPGLNTLGMLGLNYNVGAGTGIRGILTPPTGGNAAAEAGGATYGDVLGGGQAVVDAWHTYSLVWDVSNTDHQVQVFIDGGLKTPTQVGTASPFTTADIPSGGMFVVGYTGAPSGHRAVVYDNLRIWSGTDKSTSTLLLENGFEDQNLISSVGVNGTYLSGKFVAGANGNGLMTGVPEPEEYAAVFGLALVGAGVWLRRRRLA
jgi:hypothetical protein